MASIQFAIPVVWFLTSSTFSALALNSSQQQRFLLLPLIFISGILSFRALPLLTWPLGLNSTWGLGVSVWMLHITALLYHNNPIPQRLDQAQPCVQNDWATTYKLWTNTRLLDGSRSLDRHSLAAAAYRSRLKFTVFTISKICASIAVDRFVFMRALQAMHLNLFDFAAEREVYIRRVLLGAPITLSETLLRAFLSIHWIWSAYFLINTAHHTLAILFVVVLRLDEPGEWPPLFGNPLEAYTVQRFWGKFWHRLAYRPYLAYAQICADKLLKLPRNSRVRRMVVIFTIFLFSGVTHTLVAYQLGDRCGKTRDILFFIANFLAGALEMVVWEGVQLLATRHRLSKHFKHPAALLLQRLFGYIWVWTFFAWVVPKWHYAKVYCTLEDFYQAGLQQ